MVRVRTYLFPAKGPVCRRSLLAAGLTKRWNLRVPGAGMGSCCETVEAGLRNRPFLMPCRAYEPF